MRIHRDLAGWGLFFVVAGGIPLAVQTGLLPPTVLDRWWSFWPLILVGVGLGLMFTRTSLEILGGLLVSASLGLMAAGILTSGSGGIGDLPSGVCGPGGGNARLGSLEVQLDAGRATVDLSDVSQVDHIDIRLNAGSLGLYLPAVSTTGSIEANAGSMRLCAP